MPVLKERVLQAKQQRASGASNFDSGLADSLSDLFLDLTYVPKSPEDGSDQEDFDFNEFLCVFSLIEGTAEEVDMVDEDVTELDANIGKRRPFEGLEVNHITCWRATSRLTLQYPQRRLHVNFGKGYSGQLWSQKYLGLSSGNIGDIWTHISEVFLLVLVLFVQFWASMPNKLNMLLKNTALIVKLVPRLS